jgi:hypothetical protein
MNENEKLRAMLAEALNQHAHCLPCIPDCIWTRIDVALAEPVAACARCETLRAEALDAIRAKEEAERQTIAARNERYAAASWVVEARAEVERLKADHLAVFLRGEDDGYQRGRRNGFQYGAEAMREAAATLVSSNATGWASVGDMEAAIRALPVPEDKR